MKREYELKDEMDSAIILFIIITILQNILDCNGLRLRLLNPEQIGRSQQVSEPALVLALLRSNNGETKEDQLWRYLQNERRASETDLQEARLKNYNFTELKRAINLLELPIAHFVKDYHQIEMEIQKREAEMRLKQQRHRPETEVSVTTPDIPIDYFIHNYDLFKEQLLKYQNKYKEMQQGDIKTQTEETLMQEYERKQQSLDEYNNRMKRLPQESQTTEDPQASNPQLIDPLNAKPNRETIVVSQPSPDLQAQDASAKISDDIYKMPMWQTEHKTTSQQTSYNSQEQVTTDAVEYLGTPSTTENYSYNWQSVTEQSIPNTGIVEQSTPNTGIMDMSIETLVKEYRKLEQEIKRRKKIVADYKKHMKQAPMQTQQEYGTGEQLKKPEYNSQGYNQNEPTEYAQPYLSDSELVTLYTTGKPVVNTGRFQILDSNGIPSNRKESWLDLKQSFYPRTGGEIQTGIMSYPKRKSFHSPEYPLPQLYIVYLQRVREVNPRILSTEPKKKKNPYASYQYAYLDLENLGEKIQKYRRQKANPLNPNLVKKITTTSAHDEDLSTDLQIFSAELKEVDEGEEHDPKRWFLNTKDEFNHIKIDQDAPDLADFMPKTAVGEDTQWSFFGPQGDHNNDYN